MERKELEEHHKKLQEKPFSQRVKGRETFNDIKDILGENPPIPPRKASAPRPPLMTHDVPFKPSHPPRVGYNKTLGKFPTYKEDPMRVAVRRKEPEEDKAKWRATTQKRSVPCPSVTTNYKNLKSEFPSVFRRL